jgi:hypothetical protein
MGAAFGQGDVEGAGGDGGVIEEQFVGPPVARPWRGFASLVVS